MHGNYAKGGLFETSRRYPTPLSRDGKGRQTFAGSLTELQEPETWLDPRWVEWLMGVPPGWTDLAPLPPEDLVWWLASSQAGLWWRGCEPLQRLIPRGSITRYGARLCALGNGQVPAQAALALRALEHL